MGDKTAISWCDSTVNPLRARRLDNGKVGTHCVKCAPECASCYAERQNIRNLPFGTGLPYTVGSTDQVEMFVEQRVLDQVVCWKRPRKIFWCSLTDLFGEFVPDALIDDCASAMYESPQHTHLVLTKRAERMRHYWQRLVDITANNAKMRFPLPNVWIGVTAGTQKTADENIPHLLATPAANRFVSAEPLLGPLDLAPYLYGVEESGTPFSGARTVGGCASYQPPLDWVIVGGESGSGARPMRPDWARSLRDQCQAAGVPFFFKQWSGVQPKDRGCLLDGREWKEFPNA